MKKIKLILTAVFCSLMLFSCFVDDEDETLEAFSNTPYTIGFNTKVANESYFEDKGAIEASYPVVIIGGQDGSNPESDITIEYEVNTGLSTAVEGKEFDFLDNSGVLTIPAGSNFALFNILINTGNLDPDQPTKLVLDLVSATSSTSEAVVASSNNRIEITFVGCNSKIAQPGEPAEYQLEMSSARGNVSRIETITWTGPNQFETESTGHWGIDAIAPDSSMPFEVICGEVFVPDHGLMNYYSNEVKGANSSGPDGFVDPETLDFTITYTIMLSGSPVVYTATYTRID